ncbi:MAG: 8-oxoguanine deaminase [Anaerolineales bacterium]|nr:8-oxoguanine deaminase [Anaerolineales bacterium]
MNETTLLVMHADMLLTMDNIHERIPDGGMFIRGNVIEQIGPTADLPAEADRVIDARGMLIMPGLINIHHHLYQTLTRALPGAQDAKLFDWLVRLYPVWGELTDEAVYTSARLGLAELALTGCTTSTDHLYILPNDSTHDAEIKAARELGIRFHATRGSMSLGRSQGGLPPDHVVEDEDHILKDSQRVIEAYHDPEPYAMTRIALAPCSPFSVTADLMRETTKLARAYKNVMLHTHVAETQDEETFTLEKVGLRPARYMEELGWVGDDVWWVHCIWLTDDEVDLMAETGTGVAHCPSSNMRLGSGIAPIIQMVQKGVKVGIGVDGSASNDAGHMIMETRNALLLQRVAIGAASFTVMDALRLATTGSAAAINRPDLGRLGVDQAADFIGIRLDRMEMAGGAVHDPVAAVLLCPPLTVDLNVVNGREIVRDGRLVDVDIASLIADQNRIAKAMAAKHPFKG